MMHYTIMMQYTIGCMARLLYTTCPDEYCSG